MWVHLGNDGKVGVEMEIQSFEGYISPQTAVFPFVAEGIRREGSVALFHHEHNRIEDSGNSGRG